MRGSGIFSFVLGALLFLSAYAGIGIQPAKSQNTPQFWDYPAQVYHGRVRAPNLNSDPEASTYRTRLQNAAQGQVNFAGEHILTYWGCGQSCLMGAAINARTGKVTFMPHTICCWFDENNPDADVNPIDHQPDSNLLIFKGLLSEEDPMGTHYFEFRNGRFQFIQTVGLAPSMPNNNNTFPPHGNGGNQGVMPSCPAGYVLSGAQCLPRRASVPSRPNIPTNIPKRPNIPRPNLPNNQNSNSQNANNQNGGGQFSDIRFDHDLPGGDYRDLDLSSYEQCQSECQQDQQCHGFTFNMRASRCFLKWRGENWTYFAGAVSGLKGQGKHTQTSNNNNNNGGYTAYVFGKNQNDFLTMRYGPDSSDNEVGYIPGHGEDIYVHQCETYDGNEEWCEVTYKGVQGWVIGSNLQNVEGGW